MKVVVTGWIAAFPTPAQFWHSISYALGFEQLGHDVWFIEDSGDDPWGWDPVEGRPDSTCRAGVRFLAQECASVGLGDAWCFRHIPSGHHDGMTREQTLDVLADADLLVNVSLMTPMRPEYLAVPQRWAVDTDPVFTQVRVAQGDPARARVPEQHTRLYTFGRPPLPAQRHDWVPTRQPVVLDRWPVLPLPEESRLSTVSTWEAYVPVTWDGVEYAAKDRSWPEYVSLPGRTSARLVVALGGGTRRREGEELLASNGWDVVDAAAVSASQASYRRFIAGSTAELGLAKHGYVAAASGWFSERTCAYLAMGRPAVVQDTGWTRWLPAGDGLLSFRNPDEAVEGIERVLDDPQRHSAAARALAERWFSAAQVCADMLEAS